MTEFNNTERESKVKQEAVRAAVKIKEELTKLIADSYDQGVKDALEVVRNATLEEVALRFEQARDGCSSGDIMGRRWMDSAAELVRSMKK
jgi:hypothetical protein